MTTSLLLSAWLMGLVGGPHCVAMCGAACAGMGRLAGTSDAAGIWAFQGGRVLGYAALGGLSAATLQGLGWLTVQSAALRPLWSLFHLAVLAMGLALLLQARQPLWLDTGARQLWARVRATAGGWGPSAPVALGMAWALLPCGLLYSALLLAAMAGSVLGGALVMALFAAGTSVSMVLGPRLWLRLAGQPRSPRWGVRLAGAVLAASASWALWMGLVKGAAPWCTTG
jgi:sulfite exporter TauE/SafE